MASSGSFTTTSCEGRSLTFSWSIQSQSIENNTTTIAWNLKGSGSYSGYVICGGFQVIVNGSTVCNNSTDYRLNVYSGTVVASGTHTISHNNDGTKSFSASASAGIYYYDRNCSGSGSWDINTIPRASSFGTITGNTIGDGMIVMINRHSSSFTHQLWYKLGNSNWYDLGTGIGGSKTFHISTELLSQLPNSTSGDLQLCLRTYSGNTQIGSDVYKSVTVYVNSNVVPKIGNITLTPQTYNRLIQNKNRLTVSVAGCSAGTGSSIQSYTFSGPGVSSTTTSTSVTSSTISDTGTITYTVTVTDSRGRTASATKTITCYAYSEPSITLSAYRVAKSTSTTEDNSGTFARCTYNVSYASIDGNNDVTVKIYWKKNNATTWSSTTAATDANNTSGSTTLSNISIDSTYSVYATVSDNYGGSTSSLRVTLFGAERIMNIKSNGKGMSFGKMATTDNLLDSKWAINSDDPANSMKNLTYRGMNIIDSTANDTIANWCNQGNLATVFYGDEHEIFLNNQPSQWGFLLNVTDGPGASECHQIWMAQSNGAMYHRGGNHDGLATSWRTLLDSENYTDYVQQKPVVLYSGSTSGTITLKYSSANYSYIEIFYADNNSNGHNSTRIYAPNGKKIDLSLIEASDNTSQRTYIRRSLYTISGSTITPIADVCGYVQMDGTTTSHLTGSNYIKIIRVLGYK